METAKAEEGKSMSIHRISNLPEDILQRILYFLSLKEAVRTSVLSKSWRYIWCTRPNLDLSDATFNGNEQEFVSIADKTLQRYRDRRMCLEELHLRVSLGHDSDRRSVSLLERWIPLLTDIGVKDFRLSVYQAINYLPAIIFESELLQELTLKGSTLSEKSIERIVVLKHLRALCLHQVHIERDILPKILSSCPSIETLRVEDCSELEEIKVNDLHNLKDFSFSYYDDFDLASEERCSIEIHPPSLETVQIIFGNISFHKGAEFLNLNCLELCSVGSSLDHLSSCKFPSLKRLTLHFCNGLKESSHISIDAPNMVYFEYSGLNIPSISFPATSSKWDSNIHLLVHRPSSSWLVKLHVLLHSLSLANIYLVMKDGYPIQQKLVAPENSRDKLVVVERLDITWVLLSYPLSLINGLLGICRPRNIVCISAVEVTEFVCKWKILMEMDSDQNQNQFRHERSWLQDLEEVRIEVKETNREEWHPTTLSELQKYQQGEYVRTRFGLKWRQTR